MPELSRFYGIVIRMHFRDHAPPHFHATYGEDEMTVGVDPVRKISGKLPRRATNMVLQWARLRQAELRSAWQDIQTQQPFNKIDPLP